MRRTILCAAASCFLGFLPLSAGQPGPRPITVFVAKQIHTMDAGWPEATAVAVQNGKILSVGSLDDVKLDLGKRPHQIDDTFKDKVLMPGFIEAHSHPLMGGIMLTRPLLSYLPTARAYGPDFPGVKNMEEVTAKLKEYVAAEKDPKRSVIAWGFDVVAMGRHLDKDYLDSITTTQPLFVWDASEHFIYANSVAMKKAGITKAALKINGVMAGKDGQPNGQFLGATAAQYIMQGEVGRFLEPKAAARILKYFADLSRKNGITTTSELAFGMLDLELEKRVFDGFFNAPDSPLRCVVVADGRSVTKGLKDKAIGYVLALMKGSTLMLIFQGIKFFADDSFLGLGMQVTNPGYSDGRKGIWLTRPGKEMYDEWRPWWDAGFHIHVHTNGNAGNQATLDALATLQKHKPRFDHRFTCEHFGISTPEQVRELKALGGVASINPYYLYYRSEFNAPLVGSERSYTASRYKSLVDAGVPVSMHSDTPVGPPRPLEWVWIAVNRFGLSGKVRGPAERVTVRQAFRMITADAAYTLGVEDKVGTIEPGKMADFTVLEEDPFAVPVERIRDVRVWGTVVGGRILLASAIRP
jgi:predicted amidohydrolase YtcJ